MHVRVLAVALITITVGLLVAAFYYNDYSYGLWALPFGLALALAVAFRPQIDYAYYIRYPSDLEEPLVKLLDTQQPTWYAAMSAQEQLDFRQFCFIVRLGFEFRGQGFEEGEVPDDIQALIATQAARVLRGSGRRTLQPYETVVVYKHAFPSPQFPKFWHHSELYAEDGVLLFDLERATLGIMNPREYFNIVLYECLRAHAESSGVAAEQPVTVNWQEVVRQTVGIGPEWVTTAVGLDEEHIDGQAVIVVLKLDFTD